MGSIIPDSGLRRLSSVYGKKQMESRTKQLPTTSDIIMLPRISTAGQMIRLNSARNCIIFPSPWDIGASNPLILLFDHTLSRRYPAEKNRKQFQRTVAGGGT